MGRAASHEKRDRKGDASEVTKRKIKTEVDRLFKGGLEGILLEECA